MKKNDKVASATVKGQGMGISSNLKNKILNKFERDISSENISGLGLGLFIVKEIVEANGGQISVDSEVGKSSTFTITYPLI